MFTLYAEMFPISKEFDLLESRILIGSTLWPSPPPKKRNEMAVSERSLTPLTSFFDYMILDSLVVVFALLYSANEKGPGNHFAAVFASIHYILDAHHQLGVKKQKRWNKTNDVETCFTVRQATKPCPSTHTHTHTPSKKRCVDDFHWTVAAERFILLRFFIFYFHQMFPLFFLAFFLLAVHTQAVYYSK